MFLWLGIATHVLLEDKQCCVAAAHMAQHEFGDSCFFSNFQNQAWQDILQVFQCMRTLQERLPLKQFEHVGLDMLRAGWSFSMQMPWQWGRLLGSQTKCCSTVIK